MKQYKKLWGLLVVTLVATFTLLGYLGVEVYRNTPPIPQAYVDSTGQTIISQENILQGQEAWQSTGGMQIGTIWGHGAYQAPDWTADWLHRELMAWLNITAQKAFGKPYNALISTQQGMLKAALKDEYRNSAVKNGKVMLSDTRIAAIQQAGRYYDSVYGDDPAFQKTREAFAMKNNTLPNGQDRQHLNNFFFWTAWAAASNRPNSDATYTNNWPHEPLIDNVPRMRQALPVPQTKLPQ